MSHNDLSIVELESLDAPSWGEFWAGAAGFAIGVSIVAIAT